MPGVSDFNLNLTLKQSAAKAAWTKASGLLPLIQIVSVPSVVKLVWIDCTKTFLTTDGIRMGGRIGNQGRGGKDEIGERKNRKTKARASLSFKLKVEIRSFRERGSLTST